MLDQNMRNSEIFMNNWRYFQMDVASFTPSVPSKVLFVTFVNIKNKLSDNIHTYIYGFKILPNLKGFCSVNKI